MDGGIIVRRAGLQMSFIQQGFTLFIDNLLRLADRVIDRSFEISILVGANKSDSPGFPVDLTADKTRGSIFAVFIYRGGFD